MTRKPEVGKAMTRCIVCKKYSAFCDDDNVCDKCASITSRPLRFVTKNGMMPLTSNGMILSEDNWHSLQVQINKFYSTHDIEWIDERNKETIELNKWKSNRIGIPSGTPGFVYLLQASNGYYKIGRAINVGNRLKNHLRMFPLQIEVIHTVMVQDMVKAERFLLKMFFEEKLQGEWFLLNDEQADWICSLTPELLDAIVKQSD